MQGTAESSQLPHLPAAPRSWRHIRSGCRITPASCPSSARAAGSKTNATCARPLRDPPAGRARTRLRRARPAVAFGATPLTGVSILRFRPALRCTEFRIGRRSRVRARFGERLEFVSRCARRARTIQVSCGDRLQTGWSRSTKSFRSLSLSILSAGLIRSIRCVAPCFIAHAYTGSW